MADQPPARIHEHCGMLDDPARDWPCPCRAWAESRPLLRPVPTLAERRAARTALRPVEDPDTRGRGAA